MPITIHQPAGNQPPGTNPSPIFEVGQYVEAVTDFIGPLSTAAFWTTQLWLTALPTVFVLLRKYPFSTTTFKTYMWEPGSNNPAADGEGLGVRPITAGATAVLRVMLDDPTISFHEQADLAGVMATFDQFMRVNSVTGSAAGGFSDADRQLLQAVLAAVRQTYTNRP